MMRQGLAVTVGAVVMLSAGCGGLTDDSIESGPRMITSGSTTAGTGTQTSAPPTSGHATSGQPSSGQPSSGQPSSASDDGVTDGVLLGASFAGKIDFGNVTPGAEKSLRLGVRHAISGRGDVTVQSVVVSGDGFALSGDECTGVTLAPGERCFVTVTFQPTAEGAYYGSLTVDIGDPLTYGPALVGEGGGGGPSVSQGTVPPPPSQAAMG